MLLSEGSSNDSTRSLFTKHWRLYLHPVSPKWAIFNNDTTGFGHDLLKLDVQAKPKKASISELRNDVHKSAHTPCQWWTACEICAPCLRRAATTIVRVKFSTQPQWLFARSENRVPCATPRTFWTRLSTASTMIPLLSLWPEERSVFNMNRLRNNQLMLSKLFQNDNWFYFEDVSAQLPWSKKRDTEVARRDQWRFLTPVDTARRAVARQTRRALYATRRNHPPAPEEWASTPLPALLQRTILFLLLLFFFSLWQLPSDKQSFSLVLFEFSPGPRNWQPLALTAAQRLADNCCEFWCCRIISVTVLSPKDLAALTARARPSSSTSWHETRATSFRWMGLLSAVHVFPFDPPARHVVTACTTSPSRTMVISKHSTNMTVQH